MVSLKSAFSLPGRALCGFVESVFKLMNIELGVPDHTTISRRLERLAVKLPVTPTRGKRHVKVSSCKMDRQVNELTVQCLVLNRMIQVAKPDSCAC